MGIFLAFLWEIIPSRKLDRVTENKISGTVSRTKCHAREGEAITVYDCVGQSHLSNIWVGIFRVNAPVLLHILEGIGHIAPSAAIILRHTIHQVLWTQIQEFAGFLLELALQGTHRAKSPTGTTLTLRGIAEKPSIIAVHTFCFSLLAA